MKALIVEPGSLLVGSNPKSTLMTQPLGGGIAVVAYHSPKKIGGIALPLFLLSEKLKGLSVKKPTYFIETCIPFFVERFIALECQKKDIRAWIIGGAGLLDTPFKVEEAAKAQETIAQILQKNGVTVVASDMGGHHSRSVSIDIATGKITITLNANQEKAITA